MPYILVALLISAFGSGYWVADSLASKEISELNAAVSLANAQSEAIKNDSDQALIQANIKAGELNQTIEKIHESDIATINYYHAALARMPKPTSRKSCANRLPKADNSKIDTGNAEYGPDIPEEFIALLRAESYRADQAAVDKNKILSFVKNNCGIQ